MNYFVFWTDEQGNEDGRQQRELKDAKVLAAKQSRNFPSACVSATNDANDEVGVIDFIRGKEVGAHGVFAVTIPAGVVAS